MLEMLGTMPNNEWRKKQYNESQSLSTPQDGANYGDYQKAGEDNIKEESKQIHDSYGRELLREILGSRFINDTDDLVKVDYGTYISAFIDGVINNCCAIEIESRVDKQLRGALLDLLEHKLPKKS